MSRIRVVPVALGAEDYRRLAEIARREERIPEQQLRFLVRQALAMTETPRPPQPEPVAAGHA